MVGLNIKSKKEPNSEGFFECSLWMRLNNGRKINIDLRVDFESSDGKSLSIEEQKELKIICHDKSCGFLNHKTMVVK